MLLLIRLARIFLFLMLTLFLVAFLGWKPLAVGLAVGLACVIARFFVTR
jgi:hypothetical protein